MLIAQFKTSGSNVTIMNIDCRSLRPLGLAEHCSTVSVWLSLSGWLSKFWSLSLVSGEIPVRNAGERAEGGVQVHQYVHEGRAFHEPP